MLGNGGPPASAKVSHPHGMTLHCNPANPVVALGPAYIQGYVGACQVVTLRRADGFTGMAVQAARALDHPRGFGE